MCKICVFAGTTEGRELIEFLCTQRADITACVATEYGQTLLEPRENLTVFARRMNQTEMTELLAREQFDLVIDATHPYASVVTQNICESCRSTGTEYLRLLREQSHLPQDAVFVPDIPAAVDYLNKTEGTILLTTGSKELAAYRPIRDFAARVYARVLPMAESLALCVGAGLPPSHIIAMQGPFSMEMNLATLRSIHAEYMVTKESGHAGGMDDKIAAAQASGCKLVVIGRPPQYDGLTLCQTTALLCRRFGWQPTQDVFIVGIGPGARSMMTHQAVSALEQADCIIGAKRMIQSAAAPHQTAFDAISPQQISRIIRENPQFRRIAVVMSGDVGFYSGTKKLLPLLDGCHVTVIPGISSMVYLCSRLGISYEQVCPVSLHGRTACIAPQVRRHRLVFALVGGENGTADLCRTLTEAGLGDVTVHVGQELSYPEESIVSGSARDLASRNFSALSAVLIENPRPGAALPNGLPDSAFVRSGGKEVVPMTKSEVRSVCLSKLGLTAHSVCWDIGAGTGSVSVEMGLQATAGQVYAIEKNPAALELLEENRRSFGLSHMTIVPGTAPQSCADLPAPTHAFIGGSSGNMRQILALLLEKNPHVRIVATAISLESVAELTSCLTDFPFTETEVVSLTVARDRKAGHFHLMTGQNPIYIFTMHAGGGDA